jgi:hypothetical protein
VGGVKLKKKKKKEQVKEKKVKEKLNLFVLATKIYTLACYYKQQQSFSFFVMF